MAKKVNCTCGHSWDKADSSKKDAYICHICGKDTRSDVPKAQVGEEVPAQKITPEMIQGWGEYRNYLDKQGLYGDPRLNTGFGKKTFVDWATKNPNYGVNWETLPVIGQELSAHKQKVKEAVGRGKVSLSTPVSEFNASDVTNAKSKNPWWPGTEFTAQEFAEYEEKILDPKGKVVKEKQFGVLPSTEDYDKLRLDKEKVTPISGVKPGALPNKKNGGWLDRFEEGGEYLGTTNKGFNYNGAWGGTMAMGGSLPGPTGMMYGRTQGSAPANGKYTKKTMASAQNGASIPVIEDMGDFKEGVWVPDLKAMAKEAKKLGVKKIKTKSGSILYFNDKWEVVGADDAPSAQDGEEIRAVSDNTRLKPIVTEKPINREVVKSTKSFTPKDNRSIFSDSRAKERINDPYTDFAQGLSVDTFIDQLPYAAIGLAAKAVNEGKPLTALSELVKQPLHATGDVIINALQENPKGIDVKTLEENTIPYTRLAANALFGNPIITQIGKQRVESGKKKGSKWYDFTAYELPALYDAAKSYGVDDNTFTQFIEDNWKSSGGNYKKILDLANKKFSKKQNGGEMKFYQEGLDWKPRNISRDGSEIPKAQVGLKSLAPITADDVSNFFSLFSVPQKALTKLVTGEYQTPSEAMNIQNPVGAFAIDAVLDPVNLLGVGAAGKVGKAAKAAVKASKKSGALSKAYKLNPWAFKADPDAYYRMLGKEGYEDALQSGKFGPKKGGSYNEAYYSKGYPLDKVVYPKVAKEKGLLKNASTYEGPYMAEVKGQKELFSNPLWTASYSGPDVDFPIQYSLNDIPLSNPNVNIYKQDWLKGYKEVPKPTSSFKSEIDWDKWNPETPKYPELINEYNTIEESTKKADIWMKNPDGSTFKGTPEQFIQQQSSYFKKAFGDSKLVNPDGSPAFQYHGGKKGYEQFLTPQDKGYIKRDSYTGDQGIYFTPSKSRGKSYTKNTPKDDRELYQTYVNMENPYTGKIKGTFGKDQITNEQYEELLRNEYDGIIDKNLFPYHRQTIVFDPKRIKSAVGNVGFFDMTNPNIYKGLVPTVLGGAAATAIQQKKQGGDIKKDDMGYWNPENWGKPVEIGSNNITMKGLKELGYKDPLIGVSDTGDVQMMYPGEDYEFDGETVTEYPVSKNGKKINKKKPSGWLDKYK